MDKSAHLILQYAAGKIFENDRMLQLSAGNGMKGEVSLPVEMFRMYVSVFVGTFLVLWSESFGKDLKIV
jgi:hypothetical protein